MRNLAGVPAEISNPIVVDELTKAGVKTVETTFTKGIKPEVPTTFFGALQFTNGTTVAFSRDWYYWSVYSSSALPYKQATALNDRLGTVVRVDGHAGGKLVGQKGCSMWHVDSQEGLTALVVVLKTYFRKETSTTPSVTELARAKLLNNAIYG